MSDDELRTELRDARRTVRVNQRLKGAGLQRRLLLTRSQLAALDAERQRERDERLERVMRPQMIRRYTTFTVK